MTRIANATTPSEEHNEIEITSEMVEAGLDAFAEHDPRFEGEVEAVSRIYRAMAAKAQKAPPYLSYLVPRRPRFHEHSIALNKE